MTLSHLETTVTATLWWAGDDPAGRSFRPRLGPVSTSAPGAICFVDHFGSREGTTMGHRLTNACHVQRRLAWAGVITALLLAGPVHAQTTAPAKRSTPAIKAPSAK